MLFISFSFSEKALMTFFFMSVLDTVVSFVVQARGYWLICINCYYCCTEVVYFCIILLNAPVKFSYVVI